MCVYVDSRKQPAGAGSFLHHVGSRDQTLGHQPGLPIGSSLTSNTGRLNFRQCSLLPSNDTYIKALCVVGIFASMYVCVLHSHSTTGLQKVSDPPKVQLQVLVNWHLGAEN